MNLRDIKKMSDKELNAFLVEIQKSDKRICCKCGEFILERRTISVRKDYITRTLCVLCENCYISLLEYLGIDDVSFE